MAAKRPLLHLPVLAAAGTALYAASLAFVTGQQAAADARVAAEREPMRQAVARTAAERARTTGAIRRAAAALQAAGDGYASAAAASADLDDTLLVLAEQVNAATGVAASLPDRIPLPAPQTQVVQVVTGPAVNGVTGASGR